MNGLIRQSKAFKKIHLNREKVAIIHCDCEDVKSFMESYDFGELDVEFIINEGDLDFCSQINYGVSQVKTTWFSILELMTNILQFGLKM